MTWETSCGGLVLVEGSGDEGSSSAVVELVDAGAVMVSDRETSNPVLLVGVGTLTILETEGAGGREAAGVSVSSSNACSSLPDALFSPLMH